MAKIKNFTTIVDEMREFLRLRQPQANTSTGSVLRDVFINAPGAQLAYLYDNLNSVLTASSWATATGTDLDNIASNYGRTRNAGQAATGSVFLIMNGLSSTNVTVSNGSTVSTTGADAIDFRVVGDYTFTSTDKSIYAALASQYSSSLSNLGYDNVLYGAFVQIECLEVGIIGIVGTGTITVSNLANVTSVVNLSPTSNGVDRESDESLRERISLVFTGNNIGSADGYKSAALDNTSIVNAFVIEPGDLLMTRDGTVRDTSGTIITEGTGRYVDVWVRGTNLEAATDSFVYTDESSTGIAGPIDDANNYQIGYLDVITSSDFANQPVHSITSVTGSQSGSNFSTATEVTDSEGNVILNGNYMLLRDYQADQYIKVQDKYTGEIKVAKSLSTSNTRYTQVGTFTVGVNANSALGLDSLKWLTDKCTVSNETLTRSGVFNGNDTLGYSDVTDIDSVVEEIRITDETVLVTSTDSNFIIYTKHYPVKEIVSITHSRLGSTYNFQLTDASIGKVTLIGRFAPQYGDIIYVTYVWQKNYLDILEYNLVNDGVDWIEEENESSTVYGSVLLSSTLLRSVTTTGLTQQPKTPTYLAMNLTDLRQRSKNILTIDGDLTTLVENEQVTYKGLTSISEGLSYGYGGTGNIWTFDVQSVKSSTADDGCLGRILRVYNVTQGYAYNLFNSRLNTNTYYVGSSASTLLEKDQFALDVDVNTNVIEVGDSLQFSRKSWLKHWTTQTDFMNNIDNNVVPTYDSTTVDILSSGEINLKTRAYDDTIVATLTEGTIDTDTTWTGVVEVTDDLVIDTNAILTIMPGTVIKVREASAFSSTSTIQQKVTLVSSLIDTDTSYYHYIYTLETDITPSTESFTVDADDGSGSYTLYYADIIKKIRRDYTSTGSTSVISNFYFYRNDVLIDSKYYDEIDQILDSTQTFTTQGGAVVVSGRFICARKVYEDNPTDLVTYCPRLTAPSGSSTNYMYNILLEELPVTTGYVSVDFVFHERANETIVYTDLYYNDDTNIMYIWSSESEVPPTVDYILQYSKSIVKKVSISVRGTLIIDNSVSEDSMVEFTSAASTSAAGDWQGIKFLSQSRSGGGTLKATNVLKYCKIKYATTGAELDQADVNIDNCLFKSCSSRALLIQSSNYLRSKIHESSWHNLNTTSFNTYGVNRPRYYGDFLPWTYGYGTGYGYGGTYGTTWGFYWDTWGSDGYGADNILRTADDGYGADLILGTADDGYGADGIPGVSRYWWGWDSYGADNIPGTIDDGYGADATYGTADDGYGADGVPGISPRPGYSDKALVYRINNPMVTRDGEVPTLSTFPNDTTRRYVDLVYGLTQATGAYADVISYTGDYEVYIDSMPVRFYTQYIDRNGLSRQMRLTAGTDFAIEYDINGFALVFYNTHNVREFMWYYNGGKTIYVDYYTTYDNGYIKGSTIIDSGDTGIECASLATVDIVNNTFDNNTSYGLMLNDCFATIENNIVTGYSTAPILHDDVSICKIAKNNLWSLNIETQALTDIVDTDLLTYAITESTTNLAVSDYEKYTAGMVIKINNEQMYVTSVTPGYVAVLRSYNNTDEAEHSASSIISIYQPVSTFIVTGMPGIRCQLVMTDSQGTALSGVLPVNLTSVDSYTYKASFSVNRRKTFYYKYRYQLSGGNINNENDWTYSSLLRLILPQFERGSNDVVSDLQDIGSFNLTNSSTDPLYYNYQYEDYEFSTMSTCNKDYTSFSSPYDPTVSFNRYLGSNSYEQSETFAKDDTYVVLDYHPVVTSSLQNDVSIYAVSNENDTISVSSYNADTKRLYFSAALTAAQAQTYIVSYRVSVNLGSFLSSYPYYSTMNYIYNALQTVDFTEVGWTHTGVGGRVQWRYRVAATVDALVNQSWSSYYITNPFSLLLNDVYVRGNAIELELKIAGNDGSWDASGEYQYPRLEDFSLRFTPARDTSWYEVKSIQYSQRTDLTNIGLVLEGTSSTGITSSTFGTVGSDTILDVYLRKDDQSASLPIGKSKSIDIGATTISMVGDMTVVRSTPTSGDTIVADYLWVDINDSEDVYFLKSGRQYTKSRFWKVRDITAVITVDRAAVAIDSEKLQINSTSQPELGALYSATYKFEAPKENETITVNYIYNKAIQDVAEDVEAKSDPTADVLVREAFAVPLKIQATITIETGLNSTTVSSEVTAAISSYISSLTDFGVAINDSDIVSIIKEVSGVDKVTLTALGRSSSTGVNDITLTKQEYATLAEGHPIIQVSS